MLDLYVPPLRPQPKQPIGPRKLLQGLNQQLKPQELKEEEVKEVQKGEKGVEDVMQKLPNVIKYLF